MTFKKLLALTGACLLTAAVFSQEGGSFTKIEKRITEAIPKNQLDSAKYWKYKHRWLDEFKKRVTPKGEFYDGTVYYSEVERVARLKRQANNKAAGWIPAGPDQRADKNILTRGMGRINCITFHPTDPNTYWVGVAQGGVWKTTDDAGTWTPLTDDLPIMRISDIAVDKVNTDIIYICVGDYAYIDAGLSLDDRKRHTHYGIGVYKTTDGGQTWNQTGLTYKLTDLDGSLMRRVFIHPAIPNSLLAAGTGGIWTSADGGDNWTKRSDSLIWDIEADPNDPLTLYASTGHLPYGKLGTAGIMKSTDFGLTWNMLNTGIPKVNAVQRIELAVAPTNSDHIYALACGLDEGFYRLYTSLDAGVNWSSSNAGGLNILESFDGTSGGGQGTYDLALLVDPNDENKIYTGGINVWGSSDGGNTFHGVSAWFEGLGPGLHADQHQFKYNPLDGKIYVCNDGGLARTSAIIFGSWNDALFLPSYTWPTSWEYLSDGMQTSSFYEVSVSEENPGNFAAGAQDNATYFFNNNNWSNLFGGDGMDNILHPSEPDVIIGSSQYGRILYSNTGGIFYNRMQGPGNEDGEWVTPFMYEPGNPNKVYAGFGNLYTALPGANFNTKRSNFSNMPGSVVPAPISHFNIAQSDHSVIYVAKRLYFTYNQLSELWVTTNAGTNWTDVTAGLPDSLYFTYVEIDHDDPSRVWVSAAGLEAGKHVYFSDDGGNSWLNITYDLPNLPVNCIVHQDKSEFNTVYAGTDLGVYYINDTLNSWQPYNENLPNVIVSDIEIHYNENSLYAATFGRGVWKTDLLPDSLDRSIGIEESGIRTAEITLYPNPNGGKFDLILNGLHTSVTYQVIDVMGKTVASGILKINNGQHNGQLDLDLAGGMYFLKVSDGKNMRSVRFVVEK